MELQALSEFLHYFDNCIFGGDESKKKRLETVLQHLAFNCNKVLPLLSLDDAQDDRNDIGLQPVAFRAQGDEFGDAATQLQEIPAISNEDYIKLCMKQAKRLFGKDAGNKDSKRGNLG